ncbi:MAG TPA: hypothetical protein VEX15_23665 [Nocardioidaceae bacterium]|nr:hypothetical protein [Nocardioidaceae bacterium]
MIRRIGFTSLLAALLALVFLAAPTQAANPHFIQASASGPDAAGDLTVNFKIAGLGDNQTITVTASADATAVYACQNNGGNFPSDPKKTTVSGPVSASGDFTSGKNGQITDSLTLSPPTSTLTCPNGQHVVLVSVSYTNVTVSGGGDTESIPGTFSRTFFNI